MKKPPFSFLHFLFILIFAQVLSTSCVDKTEREYPRVRTLPPGNLEGPGAILVGEIMNLGSVNIEDHGFVWWKGEMFDSTEMVKVSMGSKVLSSEFQYNATGGLRERTKYTYNAYAVANGFTTYGDPVIFWNKYSLPARIDSYYPNEAFAGDTIVFKCSNIVGEEEHYQIYFETLQAQIISYNDSIIVATVPMQLTKTPARIKISGFGYSFISEKLFTLATPEIKTFSPTIVAPHDTIIIKGVFSPSLKMNKIYIGPYAAMVINSTRDELKVVIPYIDPKMYSLNISISGIQGTATEQISIIQPSEIWFRQSDFPGGEVYDAVSFSINGIGYVGLGYDISGNRLKTFWRYDPIMDNWQEIAEFPGSGRVRAVGASLQGMGFVGGGFDKEAPPGNIFRDYYSYDPGNDSWTLIGDSPSPRTWYFNSYHTVMNDMLYVSDAAYSLFSFSLFPPIWAEVSGGTPDFYNVCGGTSFSINGKLYVVYEILDFAQRLIRMELWEYDPSLVKWERKTDFPGSLRYDPIGFSINGKGYVGFGAYAPVYSSNNSGHKQDIWEYDCRTDQWLKLLDHPLGRKLNPFVFVVGESAYIGTGKNGTQITQDVYKFTPVSK